MSNLLLLSNRSRPTSLLSASTLARRWAVSAALGAAFTGCLPSPGGGGGGGGGEGGGPCAGSFTTIGYSARLESPSGDGGAPATLVGQCLPVTLLMDMNGQVPCVVIEATAVPAGEAAACNACTGTGRAPLNELRQPEVNAIQDDNPAEGFNCFCEIEQLDNGFGDPLSPCRDDPSSAPADENGASVDGFCYVDPAQGVGDPEIVAACPLDERRLLRFVGAGAPGPGASAFISCVADTLYTPDPECEEAP